MSSTLTLHPTPAILSREVGVVPTQAYPEYPSLDGVCEPLTSVGQFLRVFLVPTLEMPMH